MAKRWLAIAFAVLVVGGGGAAVWLSLPAGPRADSVLDQVSLGQSEAVSDERFAELLRTDPIAALQASVRAYPGRGFTAEFHKRERMNGTLGDEEVIDVAVQDDPYAVLMVWRRGGGLGQGTLFVRGQNDGQMRVWVSRLFVKGEDPQGAAAKRSARYTIEEFGIPQSTRRTLKVWGAAADAGDLAFEYQGRRAVPEAGGRECFVLTRTAPADCIDPFVSGGPAVEVTDKTRRDSFRTVTVYLDCETRLQVGTEQRRHDGELTASYWFRNVNLAPTFDADTFTTKSFR
jgi:hypothetical protein